MAINTASFRRAVLPILDKVFDDHERKGPEEWKGYFDQEEGEKALFEEEYSLTGFGLPSIKGQGEGIMYDEAQEGFVTRFDWIRYALGFKITEDLVDDGKSVNIASRLSKQLGLSFREAREIVHASLLNLAFAASKVYGDRKPLVTDDHPMAGFGMQGVTWSNKLTVDAQLSEAALEAMDLMIKSATDQRGKKISLKIEELIIPSKLKYVASRILKSQLRVGVNLNDINALKAEGTYKNDVRELEYLTSPTAWFVRTNVDRGFIHKNRLKLRTKMKGDFETEDMSYKADERYGINVVDQHVVYGSAGA